MYSSVLQQRGENIDKWGVHKVKNPTQILTCTVEAELRYPNLLAHYGNQLEEIGA